MTVIRSGRMRMRTASRALSGDGASPLRGTKRMDGRAPLAGKPGTPSSPGISATSPTWSAPVGHWLTHAGARPSTCRSLQNVHFETTPFAASYRGAS